jgi:hypothetical protein
MAVAAPRKDGESTSQGHPYAIFRRALLRGNALSALAAAKDLPQLSLSDALELTVLIARKDPRRHQRIAARWLLRYLEEDPRATIEEAALADSILIALTGVGYQEAAQTLRALAERASGDGNPNGSQPSNPRLAPRTPAPRTPEST